MSPHPESAANNIKRHLSAGIKPLSVRRRRDSKRTDAEKTTFIMSAFGSPRELLLYVFSETGPKTNINSCRPVNSCAGKHLCYDKKSGPARCKSKNNKFRFPRDCIGNEEPVNIENRSVGGRRTVIILVFMDLSVYRFTDSGQVHAVNNINIPPFVRINRIQQG